MHGPPSRRTRRDVLRWGAASVAAAGLCGLPGATTRALAADGEPGVVMDGHVHITNRIYWEGIDPWTPQKQGWDFTPEQGHPVVLLSGIEQR